MEGACVPNLIAKTALGGIAPVTHAGTTLAEVDPGPITSVACFPGAFAIVAKVLGGFPAPNSHAGGLAPDLAGLAAVTDQSGGWAALSLSGPMAADALMRLVPLDLGRMGPGQAARAPLGHMQMVLMGQEGGFLILVFRSMARTAWHEIEVAMKALAARKAL
jgi:heterotetrameric sarcosine oxidase gamma subunit